MLCVYYNIFDHDKAVQVQTAAVQLHRHSHGHCLRKR